MKGVLLLNLGSPDSTEIPDVTKYLEEFLMDERVIDMPEWKRKLILKLFILPRRPAQSAEAYSKVWTEEGSPLIVTSLAQQKLVQEKSEAPIFLAMRYGSPSTPDVVAEINTKLVQPYYNDPKYINALWESIRPSYEGSGAHLMMSFHGIPERHVQKTDPSHAHCLITPNCCDTCHPAHGTCYRHQCYSTSKALMAAGNIDEKDVTISFQSRLLKDPWLSPYTDHEIERLAKEGVKNLKVICPAFITDCLETLEEIAMEGRDEFLEHGGEEFELIPCLNTHPLWIQWMVDKIDNWES